MPDEHEAFDGIGGFGRDLQGLVGRRTVEAVELNNVDIPFAGLGGQNQRFPGPRCGRGVHQVGYLAELAEDPAHRQCGVGAATVEGTSVIGGSTGIPIGLRMAQNDESLHARAP